MASRLMNHPPSTSRNSDLIIRRRTLSSSSSTKSSVINHSSSGSGSAMNVDDLFRSVNGDGKSAAGDAFLDDRISLLDAAGAVAAISDDEASCSIRRQQGVRASNGGSKTVDEVWKEIMAGRSCKQEAPDEMMTLEDFLARAGAVDEEDVKPVVQHLPAQRLSGGIFTYSDPISSDGDGVVRFGSGADVVDGRGKRVAVLEPLDKAAQQRQKRMIKNRESAARSRERKQAYQVELESLATKLEEEHEMLLKEKEERTKERFMQLMKGIVPLVEKRRPRRMMRKVHSMKW